MDAARKSKTNAHRSQFTRKWLPATENAVCIAGQPKADSKRYYIVDTIVDTLGDAP